MIEIDPSGGGIVWEYAGRNGRSLESMIRSDVQALPGGNVLITESDGGRLLEVTREGKIVWEYINPVRAGSREERIAVVNWAQRIQARYFTPEFLDRLNQGGSTP